MKMSMTLLEYIYAKGIQLQDGSRSFSPTCRVRVDYENGSTEFCVDNLNSKAGTKTLCELYRQYCVERGMKNDTVLCVSVVG